MKADTDIAYAELGLTPGVPEAEVKAAWRRLVSQWHPDRNDSAGAVRQMQRINQALEAIRRAGFRSAADSAPVARPNSGAPRHTGASTGGAAGNAAGHQHTAADKAANTHADDGRRPLRTVHRRVKLTLEEAALGCTKVLRGKVTESCTACSGNGHRVLGACASCQGDGAVRRAGWYGLFSSSAECQACLGSGIDRQACQACAGAGKTSVRSYQVSVRIPHGVRHGDQLQVDARSSRAGHAVGAIELRVELRAHQRFSLDDDGTLRCEMPVNGFAWIAQRDVEVPTLGGVKQRLRLNREQRCYRLKGEGFPAQRRGARGDLLVTVLPTFPQRFSADQEILLDQLIASAQHRPR